MQLWARGAVVAVSGAAEAMHWCRRSGRSGVSDTTVHRVIGLDLGVTSLHSAVVLDETGRVRARRRVSSTVDSLGELEQIALGDTAEGTTLTVVIEPTGPMWLPIAVYFGRRGHRVVRVSSAKAADLRRFLSRHAKSNGIDAETLARMPMVAPSGLHPVELSGADRACLDRRVRTVARLTREVGQRKVRIRALAQTLIPTIGDALGDGINRTDLGEQYGKDRCQEELPPRFADRDERRDGCGEQGGGQRRADRVVATPSLEQTGLPNLPGKSGVLAAGTRRRSAGRAVTHQCGGLSQRRIPGS
jgi:hypothetical protein